MIDMYVHVGTEISLYMSVFLICHISLKISSRCENKRLAEVELLSMG